MNRIFLKLARVCNQYLDIVKNALQVAAFKNTAMAVAIYKFDNFLYHFIDKEIKYFACFSYNTFYIL